MMVFVCRYKEPFDRITSDKNLKQAKKYELDNEEWEIVSDLVSVLGVSYSSSLNIILLLMHSMCMGGSSTRRLPYSSRKIRPASLLLYQQWIS